MKIKLNSGVEYWVSWYHQNPIKNENKMSITIFSSETPCTECIIENKTNSHIRGKGIAKLGKKEKQFNKDFGRKISLKKAMTTIGLNKETRTLFWNEYHKLTNKPQRIIYKYSNTPTINYDVLMNKEELDHLSIK